MSTDRPESIDSSGSADEGPRPTTSRMRVAQDRSRAVAVTLNYVLVLGIATILVTGLLVAGGSFVEDQREGVIDSELAVIGNHLAGNIEQVDRMARAGEDDPSVAHVNQTFQTGVSGTTYTVQMETDPDTLVVRSSRPARIARIPINTRTQLDDGAFASGGEMTVYYDPDGGGGDGHLVIDDV